MLADWRLRLRTLFRRTQVEDDLDRELTFHLERQTEVYVSHGLDRATATRRARLEFGGLGQVKDEYRDTLGVRVLDEVRRDVHYAWRTLRRSPGFALGAIVSLALGIGANTLVLSVANGLIFSPLPIRDPQRVVFVQYRGPFVSHSFPVYRELRDRNVTFDSLAGYRITMMDVEADGHVTHEWGYLATGNYFDLLGVMPVVGRVFHPPDDRVPGASPYAVLDYDYWRGTLGGNADVVGSTIRINRQAYTVLGVAPAGFHGTEVFYRPSIWVPMMMQAQIEVDNPWLDNRNTANTWVIGRLRSGVTAAQAEGNLTAIVRQVAQESGGKGEGIRLALTQPGLIGDSIGGPARVFAVGVLILAGLVLVLACVNLAGALTARGSDRQRELAIRLSMGASRGRIVRQLFTETTLLALLGGAAGGLLAATAAAALSRWRLPIAVPVQFDVRPDGRVFAFTLAMSLLAGLLFGLFPARHATRTDAAAALKLVDGARRRRWPVREVLVAVQIVLCSVLVTSSVVSLRGLLRAVTMRFGFEPAGVAMASFDLGLAGYTPDNGERLRRAALEAMRRQPGVEAAAYGNSLPLNIDQSNTAIYPDGTPIFDPTQVPYAIRYQVSPAFFRTLGIRFRLGRDIEWSDSFSSRRVAVVNETFAGHVLKQADPLGQRFRFGPGGPLTEVIGLVEDGQYQSLTEAATPAVFVPILQHYNTTTVLLVKSSLPSGQMISAMRAAMQDLDSGIPLFGVGTLDQMLSLPLLPMRVAAVALGSFGLLALVLAATGVYGLVAYAVARRRREVAIRVALGASGMQVLRLLLGRISIVIGVGAMVGLGFAVASDQLLRSIVYQASPRDVGTLLVVGAGIGLVGLVASLTPARRALRINPARALHVE
jgi:predicted permease